MFQADMRLVTDNVTDTVAFPCPIVKREEKCCLMNNSQIMLC